jgi:release factor glutamine methyltransferase
VPSARDLLAAAESRLAEAGVPSPRVDAELLLAHVTGRPRGLLRMSGTGLSEEQADRFRALVEQRSARVPLQHLTGRAPFRHLELSVGPGVFIPRPETELVVDAVTAHLAVPDASVSGRSPLLVDLCSGSGALAVALAVEVPRCRVHAVEVSDDAIGWLHRNVTEHGQAIESAGSVVEVQHADATRVVGPGGALAGLQGQVDVVVTNPPYVPDDAVPREPEVRDHDPALALYGGPDGLDVVRLLARQAAQLLRPGGLLVVEHADVQGEAGGESGVPSVLRAQRDHAGGSWTDVLDHLDLAGLPRFTTAVRTGAPGPQDAPPGRGRMSP